jgi:hypothetical protein
MCAGVGKSGSPAPKPMTGSPAALSALALASTASVADSVIPATREEMRRVDDLDGVDSADCVDGNGLAPCLGPPR